MKIYVTFCENHVHHIKGEQFDNKCVGIMDVSSYKEGVLLLQKHLQGEYWGVYSAEVWRGKTQSEVFPDGYKILDFTEEETT